MRLFLNNINFNILIKFNICIYYIMNKNTRKNNTRNNNTRNNNTRNNNTRNNKMKMQKGGDWGTFFFGSVFGAAILKWLDSPVRSNQSGGKNKQTYIKKIKTRKNKI